MGSPGEVRTRWGDRKTLRRWLPSFIIIKAHGEIENRPPRNTIPDTLTDEKEANRQLDAWKTDFFIQNAEDTEIQG